MKLPESGRRAGGVRERALSDYDVAVLGGGTGGYVAALRAAVRGAKACCVEAGPLGGTCLNVGCIPTKAMLHASGLLWEARSAGELGLAIDGARADGPALMARVGRVVAGLREGVEFLLRNRKVEVLRGRGRLVAADTLAVETPDGPVEVTAKALIVATGSRPARPAFVPWDSPRVWTTDEATTASDLPRSVLIVGGGVIGCEFATIYSELGIPTTVVEMLPAVAPGLGRDASTAVLRSLKRRGVTVLTSATIAGMSADASSVTAELEDGRTVQAARALVAVGRVANTEDIGLEALGVTLDRGVVAVDDRCRTGVEGLFAVGDVAETRQYAHLAARMGIVAADNALGIDARDDRRVVPEVVYTHPQAASVGLSQAAAREQGRHVRVARFPYRASGMAAACGQTEGQVKLLADADGGAVLGAGVIGQGASDVIAEIALAVRNGLTVEQVAETMHPHPSFAEAVGEAAEALLHLPLHVLR